MNILFIQITSAFVFSEQCERTDNGQTISYVRNYFFLVLDLNHHECTEDLVHVFLSSYLNSNDNLMPARGRPQIDIGNPKTKNYNFVATLNLTPILTV